MAIHLIHKDPEVVFSSVIGFLAAGRLVEWFAGHADLFASISYTLASIAAIVTIYYKIKNKGK